jgi:hypothetical protein
MLNIQITGPFFLIYQNIISSSLLNSPSLLSIYSGKVITGLCGDDKEDEFISYKYVPGIRNYNNQPGKYLSFNEMCESCKLIRILCNTSRQKNGKLCFLIFIHKFKNYYHAIINCCYCPYCYRCSALVSEQIYSNAKYN